MSVALTAHSVRPRPLPNQSYPCYARRASVTSGTITGIPCDVPGSKYNYNVKIVKVITLYCVIFFSFFLGKYLIASSYRLYGGVLLYNFFTESSFLLSLFSPIIIINTVSISITTTIKQKNKNKQQSKANDDVRGK